MYSLCVGGKHAESCAQSCKADYWVHKGRRHIYAILGVCGMCGMTGHNFKCNIYNVYVHTPWGMSKSQMCNIYLSIYTICI